MDAENDVLFLILTSHGSRDGLAVKAGRLTQMLTPPNLADMLARTGVRHKVVVSGIFVAKAVPGLFESVGFPAGSE